MFVFFNLITTPFQKRHFSERPNTCRHVDRFTKGGQLSNEIVSFIDTHNLFVKYQELISSSYNSVTALSNHLTAIYYLD